jgi:hypothetical protein
MVLTSIGGGSEVLHGRDEIGVRSAMRVGRGSWGKGGALEGEGCLKFATTFRRDFVLDFLVRDENIEKGRRET